MIAIHNAVLVLENELLPNGVLLIENGKIAAFGRSDEVTIPSDAETIDADGLFVGPGFVDIHVHGGGGCRFDTDPAGAADWFLKHGETTVLPTFYTDLDCDGYRVAADRVRSVMARGEGRNIAGLYMEGPYMNPKYGSLSAFNKWRDPISEDDVTVLTESLSDLVRVWAVAPEREGILSFVEAAARKKPGVAFSVAHSEATPAQVCALKPYGLRIQTHCTDATGCPPVPRGTRSCGPDEACFLDDDIYAEVICDSLGIHVCPDMLRLIRKIKGIDRIVLITDSMVQPGENPPELRHVTDLSFAQNGDLCGSKLTMPDACRNLRKHIGVSIPEVFCAASRNPAQAVGLGDEIGTIAVGKKADLVFIDNDFGVRRVFLGGEPIA